MEYGLNAGNSVLMLKWDVPRNFFKDKYRKGYQKCLKK